MKNEDYFKDFDLIDDKSYPLIKFFSFENKTKFLILEPAIISQINSLGKLIPEKMDLIISEIKRRVDVNEKVYIASDFEHPFYDIKDFIYLELSDILDYLNIYIEDKSRPSDYGD